MAMPGKVDKPDEESNGSRSVGSRAGRAIARFRWGVIGCWLLLLVASFFLVPRFEDSLTGPPLDVSGSESEEAGTVLGRNFENSVGEQDLVVFQSETLTVEDPAYRRVVDATLEDIRSLSLVTDVIGPFDRLAQDQVSGDGRVAAAVVNLGGSGKERQRFVPELIRTAEAGATGNVEVYVTGKTPLLADLVRQEREDLNRAERLGLPVALVVLIVASGTLVAGSIPLILAMAGVAVTFGVLGAATVFAGFHFNLFVPNIATMLGLGVGIDYALLIVSRYREERERLPDAAAAVAATLATAGKTVLFSGATVVLSLSGLMLVNAPIFHELAIGAMTAVGVMLAGALTLTPAVLAVLDRRVDRLSVLKWRRGARSTKSKHGFWARWAAVVMRRPVLWTIGSAAALIALAVPAADIELGLNTGTNELNHRAAARGREVLEREFNESAMSPIPLLVMSNDGALDDEQLDAVARLTEEIEADPEVANVISVTSLLDEYAGNHRAATLEAAESILSSTEALGNIVNFDQGRNITVLRVIPYSPPDSGDAQKLVRRLRNDIAPAVVAGENLDVLVGGLSAQIVDISDESQEKLPVVAGVVTAMSFLLLTAAFRSIVLPIKAIMMNMLGIVAAYGLLVFVFQREGDGLFHLTTTQTTQVYLPLLTFAILFGLSMDYEVFLLGRMKEEMDRTGDNRTAVSSGLQHTAGVITSAAAIMIVVFAAFTFARLTEVQQLGFSLAVAVFLDATLVRLVLVPAAMQLLGRWNWWLPSWLDRIVPNIDLGEGGDVPGNRAVETQRAPAR
jgi:RND superfamily putative drug exporter